MQKSRSVQNIISIIAVADEYSMQFLCIWFCVPPDFVVQINEFFNMVLFSVVIHKRRGKKLISKTIKYKLDGSSKMQIVFFYPKDIQNFFWKLSVLLKIWKWRKQQEAGCYVLCVIITQHYEDRYVVHSLSYFRLISKASVWFDMIVYWSYFKSIPFCWKDYQKFQKGFKSYRDSL